MAQPFERQWNCHICGSLNLLAETHAYCPNCSFARSRSVHFPDWDDLQTVETHRFNGEHSMCCDTGWSEIARHCGRCGGALQPSASRVRRYMGSQDLEVDVDLSGLADFLAVFGNLDGLDETA